MGRNNRYKNVSNFLKISNATSFATFGRTVQIQLENTNSVGLGPFSKLLLNHSKLEKKTFQMKKQRIFISFPTPYHMPLLDQPFRNYIKKTNSAVRFTKFYVFSNYSLTTGNQRKLSTCGRSGFTADFQRHIICLIPINGLKMRSKIQLTFFV